MSGPASAFAAGALALVAVLAWPQPGVAAESCPRADALGVARTIDIGAERRLELTGKPARGLRLAAKEIVLTFDDGPVAGRTDAILDILAGECVRATFFMLGKRIEQFPALAARVAARGHTVGTHSWSHADLSTLPPEEARREIVQPLAAAEAALKTSPRLFRYPFWKRSPATDAVALEQKLVPLDADLSPGDWRNGPPEASMAALKAQLARTDRGVIVMHDVQANTAALLVQLLGHLKAEGYRIVHLRAP